MRLDFIKAAAEQMRLPVNLVPVEICDLSLAGSHCSGFGFWSMRRQQRNMRSVATAVQIEVRAYDTQPFVPLIKHHS